jgi:drug/metabolite transporter (DMT)-like permease
VAIYVVLAGVASFIEKPAGRGFGAFQLNALIRAGSLAAALVTLAFARGLAFPATSYLLAGLGIGLLTGAGSMLYCFGLDYLPVSLVVTLSNLYIVITIVLGIAVLHEPVTVLKIGAADAACRGLGGCPGAGGGGACGRSGVTGRAARAGWLRVRRAAVTAPAAPGAQYPATR